MKTLQRIHCIAIGGIGVSAIAKLYSSEGIVVSGSDLQESEITRDLEENYNIKVHIGSAAENIDKDIDLVIYSPAVPKSDLEYQAAQAKGIECISYPEALGRLSREKTTIAISGTNGKTTTTSMLLEGLEASGIEPDVIIGGILQKYQTNFRKGSSDYFITEACEYKRSFLNINHDLLVITNITEDHLDYFTDLADIQSAFIELLDNNKGLKKLICNIEDKNLAPVLGAAKEKGFEIINYGKYLDNDRYQIALPGSHNRQNMAAALAVIEAIGINPDLAAGYLKNHFKGTKRRMEHVGETNSEAILYDDYAHNPEGIKLLIQGLRDTYPEKKIILLFEPHLYSRTEDFKEGFAEELSQADILYLFPVYKAREEHQAEKDFLLAEHIKMPEENFFIVKNPNNFKSEFEAIGYDSSYVVVTVGAGDIWQHGISIKKQNL